MHDDTQDTTNETRGHEDILELMAFSLTAEQAAERFKEAGFPRDARTVGRWCQAGELTATKAPTKNGLSRYLISAASVEAKVERLRLEREAQANPHIYTTANGDKAAVAMPTRRHDEDRDDGGVSPSSELTTYESQASQREELAELRGRLSEKDEQARRDVATIEKLRNENGGLRIALGQAKGRSEVLEEQLKLLHAPKPIEPDTAAPPPKVSRSWRRWFGGQ